MQLVHFVFAAILLVCLNELTSARIFREKRAIVDDNGDLKFKVRANYRNNGIARYVYFRCSVLTCNGPIQSLVIRDVDNDIEMGRLITNVESASTVYQAIPGIGQVKVDGAVNCFAPESSRCGREMGYIRIQWKDIDVHISDDETHRNYTCEATTKFTQLSLPDDIRIKEEPGHVLENRDTRTPEMFLKLRADFRSNSNIRNLFFRCSTWVDVLGWDEIYIKNNQTDDVIGVVNATGYFPTEKISGAPRALGALVCPGSHGCNAGETGYLRVSWQWIDIPDSLSNVQNFICEAKKGHITYNVDGYVRVRDEGEGEE